MTKSPRRVWKSIGALLGLTLVVAIAAGALFLHRHREAIRCHRIEGTGFEEVRPEFYLHPDLPRLPRVWRGGSLHRPAACDVLA